MHEGTPVKSHITKFSSIINDSDKIEVKIEDKDRALLLLCSLPSSYKRFRKAIIYGDKSIEKVNEVKEHLLNKDKLTTSWRVSLIVMIPASSFSKEKSNNESSMGNPKHKNLVCNWCHKKRQIRADCWTHKKKQDANVTELAGGDEDKCDVLSVTDRSIGNKDRWIIDSECSQHISSNRTISSYTSVQGGKTFMGNSATSKVIGEETIQFHSHDGCITTLQGVRHVPESRYNLISLIALHGKGFNFSTEGDLMEVFKDTRVKFQAKRVGNVYIL